MKKLVVIFIVTSISTGFSIVNWGVSDSLNNIVCYPESTSFFTAKYVSDYVFTSFVIPRHNAQISAYGATYIGVRSSGTCWTRLGTYTFKRELGVFDETISQAVFWFCADDTVEQIGVKWDGVTHWSYNIPANKYGTSALNQMYEMHRVDLTDLFLDYDYSSVCSLIIPVRNTGALRLGLNYFYTIEDSLSLQTYYYDMKYGWNHISMPYRINNTTLTLLDIFPGALAAYYYDETIRAYNSLSLTSPLQVHLVMFADQEV